MVIKPEKNFKSYRKSSNNFAVDCIPCKESILIMKKIEFEIFTHLRVSRSPEFTYYIFTMMCICVSESACAYG